MILDKSWRWQNTGVPWLSCRNGMRDPIVVGLYVWRGEDSRGVETRELWQGQQVSQHQSSGLAEFWGEFPQTVSKSITLSFNTNTYLNAEVRRKQNVCDFENGVLDTEFNLTPKGCLWQDQTNFFKLVNEAFKYDFESEEGFTFCAFPPFNTLSTEKLKRDSGSSEENLQVVVVEGGTTSQRRLLFWLMLLLLLRKK